MRETESKFPKMTNRTEAERQSHPRLTNQNFLQDSKVESTSNIKIFADESSSQINTKDEELGGRRKIDLIKIPNRNNEREDNSRLANFAHNIISRNNE